MNEVSALSEPTELILSRSSSNQQDYKRHCLSWLSCNMMRLSSNMNESMFIVSMDSNESQNHGYKRTPEIYVKTGEKMEESRRHLSQEIFQLFG